MCYLVVLYWIYYFISIYTLILQCLIFKFIIFSYFFLLIYSLYSIIFLSYFFNFLFLQSTSWCASISLKVLLISSCTSFEIHLIIKKGILNPYWTIIEFSWIFLFFFIYAVQRSKIFSFFLSNYHFFSHTCTPFYLYRYPYNSIIN